MEGAGVRCPRMWTELLTHYLVVTLTISSTISIQDHQFSLLTIINMSTYAELYFCWLVTVTVADLRGFSSQLGNLVTPTLAMPTSATPTFFINAESAKFLSMQAENKKMSQATVRKGISMKTLKHPQIHVPLHGTSRLNHEISITTEFCVGVI